MFSQSWNFDAIPKNDYVWEWWPFKDIANNNDDAVGELQFDLIELYEVNPELALGDLDADGLINIDVRTLTNSARPLAEKENVNEYSDKPPAEVADGESNDDENDDDDDSITWTTPPTRNDIDGAIKMLTKLSLFADDVEFDPLLLKLARKSTQKHLQTMWQRSVDKHFK